MDLRDPKLVFGTQLRAFVDFGPEAPGGGVPGVEAIMISFAEIISRPRYARCSSRRELRKHHNFSGEIFLDNGSFTLKAAGVESPIDAFVEFVKATRPDLR